MDQTLTEEDKHTYAARGVESRACQAGGILAWLRFTDYKNTWNLVALGHEAVESLLAEDTE